MARTAYLAPGVFVEEVPSAQQPIAAVGTNTVGFIGVVPDEIQFPITNEDYDPQAAAAATRGPEANKQEIEQAEKNNQALTDRQTDVQKAIDALNTQLAGVNP